MKKQKADTHEKILGACAKVLRKQGVSAATVAQVMHEAGMTVGGFYAHFDSKEAMVAEGFRRALLDSNAALMAPALAEPEAGKRLRTYARGYLTPSHRDQDAAGRGCAVAALATDMAKAGPGLRKVFAEEFQKLVFANTEGLGGEGARMPRKEFLGAFATLAGALILARATRGSPISDEILEAGLFVLGVRRGES